MYEETPLPRRLNVVLLAMFAVMSLAAQVAAAEAEIENPLESLFTIAAGRFAPGPAQLHRMSIAATMNKRRSSALG